MLFITPHFLDNVLLHDSHVARMKISNDGEIMAVSLHSDPYLVCIRNLDYNKLLEDIGSSLRYTCTLIQRQAHQYFNAGDSEDVLIPESCFRKRNKVELLLQVRIQNIRNK